MRSERHALGILAPRAGAKPQARELPAAAGLCALVLLSTALRLAVGRTVPAPTIFPDELVYSELARGFAASGDFVVRDTHVAAWTYGPLYPILVSPAYLISHSTTTVFALVKAINAALFSLAAVPAYFLARRVVTRRASLAAAGFALLVPSGVYSTKVMAESISYPTFLLALLGIVAALERPSRRNQLLALGAIGLSVSARPQMVILLPALLSAMCLASWIEWREARQGPSLLQRLSAFKVLWLTTLGVVAAGLAAASFGSRVLGTYSTVLHHLRLHLAPERLLWLIGDLDLYAAVIPFAAFLLLTTWAIGRSSAPRPLRLFVIVVGTTSLWLFGLIAVYTTAFPYVYDRYAFYLVPLFTIALLAWIEQGAPRPKAALAAAAVAAAALLPLGLPLGRLLSTGQLWGANASSVGLVPWALVGVFVGHGFVLQLLVLAFSLGLGLSVARARPERAWSLARISASLFVLASLTVNVGNSALATDLRDAGPRDRAWIDEKLGPRADVALIWKGHDRRAQPADHRFGLRETVFFNRAVGPVYDLEDPLLPGTRSTHVSLRGDLVVRDDGSAVRARYVVAAATLAISGARIAGDMGSGLWLYRVPGVIRITDAGPGHRH